MGRGTPSKRGTTRETPISRVSLSERDGGAKGATESAVDEHIAALRREHSLDTGGEAHAALALRLARLIDEGEPVMMTASWARELRATLVVLTKQEAPGDGDDDSWVAGLSASLRDPED